MYMYNLKLLDTLQYINNCHLLLAYFNRLKLFLKTNEDSFFSYSLFSLLRF